jgi:hypothetical protein
MLERGQFRTNPSPPLRLFHERNQLRSCFRSDTVLLEREGMDVPERTGRVPPGPVRTRAPGEQRAARSQESGLGRTRRSGQPARGVSGEWPLVGRAEESQLGWEQLRQTPGAPQVVVIAGAAGVGKTRLARALADRDRTPVGHVSLRQLHRPPPPSPSGRWPTCSPRRPTGLRSHYHNYNLWQLMTERRSGPTLSTSSSTLCVT